MKRFERYKMKKFMNFLLATMLICGQLLNAMCERCNSNEVDFGNCDICVAIELSEKEFHDSGLNDEALRQALERSVIDEEERRQVAEACERLNSDEESLDLQYALRQSKDEEERRERNKAPAINPGYLKPKSNVVFADNDNESSMGQRSACAPIVLRNYDQGYSLPYEQPEEKELSYPRIALAIVVVGYGIYKLFFRSR